MTLQRFKVAIRAIDCRAGARSIELPLLSVSQYRGVVPRAELAGDEGRATDLGIYKTCRPGDIVLNRMSAYNGAVGLATQEGIVSPDYLVLRPTAQMHGAFLTYLIRSREFVAEIARRVKGIGSTDSGVVRTPRIGLAELGEIRVQFPPIGMQRAISDYLDRETAQIDAFIAKNEHLIALLQERREALVAHILAVGLGSSPPVRQWRASQLATLINGFPFDAQEFDSHGEVPLVRIRDLTAQRFETFVPALSVPPNAVIRDNDVLIGMDGDFNAVLWNRGAAALNQRVCALRVKGGLADPRFLNYAIAAPLRRINELTWSTTVKHLSTGAVRSIRVPGFAFQEQLAISDHLDMKTAEIDEAITAARTAVALASERRAALIAAAVTGKIDVGVAA